VPTQPTMQWLRYHSSEKSVLGRGVYHPTSYSAKFKEGVEL